MPISSFSSSLQHVISFLPGSYATSLFRNHALRGALSQLSSYGVSAEVTDELRDALDCSIYFFGKSVPQSVMYAVVITVAAALTLIFAAISAAGQQGCRHHKESV